MPKKAKTPEEKARDKFEDMTFTTIDGRELNMKDYFRPEDFAVGERADDVYIKHIGLVRVLKQLFFVKARLPRTIQAPTKENEWCAAVEVQYCVIPKTKDKPILEYIWGSTADCRTSNAMQGFNKYTTTNAETRASGRAIRQLLGVDFCTMEEVADQLTEVEIDNSPIQPPQQLLIEKKFMAQCGITLAQIRKLLKKSEEELPILDDLTRSQAADLINLLNKNLEKLMAENKNDKKEG
jgi:hypothetical protein